MILATKTLTAINQVSLVKQAKEPPRLHLGASAIGEECRRKVFYSYRWASSNFFEARMLRLFNRGHREEAAIIALLRAAGVVVYDAGESGELKSSMRISAHGGHFGGTPDGVATNVPDLPPDEPCLLEFKTHNTKAFELLIKSGVYESNRKYYIQMQVYMHELDLKWALYCGVCKDDDRLHMQMVEYNRQMALTYLQHGHDIIYATEPPPRINESPGFWKCKFCNHAQVCHFGAPPLLNCRTCEYANPIPNGLWACARNKDEIHSCPQSGCTEYKLNANHFKDEVPF